MGLRRGEEEKLADRRAVREIRTRGSEFGGAVQTMRRLYRYRVILGLAVLGTLKHPSRVSGKGVLK